VTERLIGQAGYSLRLDVTVDFTQVTNAGVKPLLVDLWPELDLPEPVRAAWQPLIDHARNGPRPKTRFECPMTRSRSRSTKSVRSEPPPGAPRQAAAWKGRVDLPLCRPSTLG